MQSTFVRPIRNRNARPDRGDIYTVQNNKSYSRVPNFRLETIPATTKSTSKKRSESSVKSQNSHSILNRDLRLDQSKFDKSFDFDRKSSKLNDLKMMETRMTSKLMTPNSQTQNLNQRKNKNIVQIQPGIQVITNLNQLRSSHFGNTYG